MSHLVCILHGKGPQEVYSLILCNKTPSMLWCCWLFKTLSIQLIIKPAQAITNSSRARTKPKVQVVAATAANGDHKLATKNSKHTLTLLPPMPLRLYTLPYWSNPTFLIFDIRALWCSGLSIRVPECQKLTSSSAIADRLCDCLCPKSLLSSCRHCQWFCAGPARHQRCRSYLPGKKNKDWLAGPAQILNRYAPGRPAQNISICRAVCVLWRRWVTFGEYLTGKGTSPTNQYWCQKTRVIAVSCGVKISAVHHLVLSQYMHLTDTPTDRRTALRQQYHESHGKNGGLDQYGTEPFEQQQYGTAGVKGVNKLAGLSTMHTSTRSTVA